MDTSGLTSGVDYFGNVGQRRNVFLNRAAPTIEAADTEVPQDTGFRQSGGERGFSSGSGRTPTQQEAFNMGMAGAGIGLLGAATDRPELGMMGGFLGSSAAASQGNFAPLVSQTVGMVSQNADAANLANLATQAYQSYANRATPDKTALDPEGQYLGSVGTIQNANRDAALYSSLGSTVAGQMVPGYNLANLALVGSTGLFGDMPTSLGNVISNAPMGYDNFNLPLSRSVDAAQGQSVIQGSTDPLGTMLGVRGYNISENPQAMQDAQRAAEFAYNTPFGGLDGAGYAASYNTPDMMGPPTSNAYGGTSTDSGSYGISSGSVGGGAAGSINNSMSQSGMLSSQESGFNSGESGGGGGGGSRSGSVGGGAEGSINNSMSQSGMMSSQESGFKDGGMIGDMPGLTKRYNNGGMVSGGPMLAMGYADGGMMGQMGGKPTPAIVNKQVDAMLRDPRARQSLLARPQQLMASGELTPDEVTTMARVAEASLYNPELYPQLRQFVAQQGMTPLPAAFDPSVIMRIMAIARGLQAATPPGQVPGTEQAQMQRPVPGDGNGGYLQGPGTGRSDSIGTVNETTGEPVKVANGEYVIPAHVVRAKGREFFDNLLRRYSDVPKGE
jgi:hypothetical protein